MSPLETIPTYDKSTRENLKKKVTTSLQLKF